MVDDQPDDQRKDDVLEAPRRDGRQRGNRLREPRERRDEERRQEESQEPRAEHGGAGRQRHQHLQRDPERVGRARTRKREGDERGADEHREPVLADERWPGRD